MSAPSAPRDLAAFDLDQTLLTGDSDYLWGQFLANQGLVDRSLYEAANRRFYEDYRAGRLDILAFSRFSLEPLTRMDKTLRHRLRTEFVAQCITPIVAPGAPALLEHHRRAGHRLIITTSTNRFVTAPIAALLGIDDLLATEPEMDGERFTGRVQGIPNFRSGKVTRLREWMTGQGTPFARLHAYTDSINDLSLLEAADLPVAVDPDAPLHAIAAQRGWHIISLRGGTVSEASSAGD